MGCVTGWGLGQVRFTQSTHQDRHIYTPHPIPRTFLLLLPVIVAHALVRPRIVPAAAPAAGPAPRAEGRRLRVEPVAHGQRGPQLRPAAPAAAGAAGDEGRGLCVCMCVMVVGEHTSARAHGHDRRALHTYPNPIPIKPAHQPKSQAHLHAQLPGGLLRPERRGPAAPTLGHELRRVHRRAEHRGRGALRGLRRLRRRLRAGEGREAPLLLLLWEGWGGGPRVGRSFSCCAWVRWGLGLGGYRHDGSMLPRLPMGTAAVAPALLLVVAAAAAGPGPARIRGTETSRGVGWFCACGVGLGGGQVRISYIRGQQLNKSRRGAVDAAAKTTKTMGESAAILGAAPPTAQSNQPRPIQLKHSSLGHPAPNGRGRAPAIASGGKMCVDTAPRPCCPFRPRARCLTDDGESASATPVSTRSYSLFCPFLCVEGGCAWVENARISPSTIPALS